LRRSFDSYIKGGEKGDAKNVGMDAMDEEGKEKKV